MGFVSVRHVGVTQCLPGPPKFVLRSASPVELDPTQAAGTSKRAASSLSLLHAGSGAVASGGFHLPDATKSMPVRRFAAGPGAGEPSQKVGNFPPMRFHPTSSQWTRFSCAFQICQSHRRPLVNM